MQILKLFTEASSIVWDELDDSSKKTALAILKALKLKESNVVDIFDGIHGKIIMIAHGHMMDGIHRFSQKELAGLAKVSGLRWVENNHGYISVGF